MGLISGVWFRTGKKAARILQLQIGSSSGKAFAGLSALDVHTGERIERGGSWYFGEMG